MCVVHSADCCGLELSGIAFYPSLNWSTWSLHFGVSSRVKSRGVVTLPPSALKLSFDISFDPASQHGRGRGSGRRWLFPAPSGQFPYTRRVPWTALTQRRALPVSSACLFPPCPTEGPSPPLSQLALLKRKICEISPLRATRTGASDFSRIYFDQFALQIRRVMGLGRRPDGCPAISSDVCTQIESPWGRRPALRVEMKVKMFSQHTKPIKVDSQEGFCQKPSPALRARGEAILSGLLQKSGTQNHHSFSIKLPFSFYLQSVFLLLCTVK